MRNNNHSGTRQVANGRNNRWVDSIRRICKDILSGMSFISSLLVGLWVFIMPGMAFANVLGNPPYVVDGLKILEGSEALLRGAEVINVEPLADKSGVKLVDNACTGSITLSPITTEFPFNEAIPSWNGWTPPLSGFRVWLRVKTSKGWTDWFKAGTWGILDEEKSPRKLKFAGGEYDYDTILLNEPATDVQFRVDFVSKAENRPSFKEGVTQTYVPPSPSLRLIAIAYTNSLGDKKLWEKFGDKRPAISTTLNDLRTTEILPIPFRSQVVPRKEIISRICSPVSVCMVMEYFGINRPSQEVAERVYDPQAKMFGIWTRAVQAGAQYGLRGYIQRFRNWDTVRSALKQDKVICASIRFKLGELTNPPIIYRKRGTGGHLIVIKGFAPGGKVVTNDPASTKFGRDLIWDQEDLARAWFDKGGVGYVFSRRR